MVVISKFDFYGDGEMNDKLDNAILCEDYSRISALADGSFQEKGEGKQFSEVFWENAKTATYHHQHLRVSELRTELTYQYKLDVGRVWLRTLQYKMSTRPAGRYWYRANIDVAVISREIHRVNSPDAMWQDEKWHSYVTNFMVPFSGVSGASVLVRVEYDGTNNGVGEQDSWGESVQLIF